MIQHVLIGVVAALLVASAEAGNLVKNGSFEKPPVPDGGSQTFNSGDSFSHWKVVGSKSIYVVSGDLMSSGFTFPAKKGKQWLDTNAFESGVEQKIMTQPGATYNVTFYIGNIHDPVGIYGTTSTYNLLVDGVPAGTFTNSLDGGSALIWQKFSTEFVAQRTKTAIAFTNGDPPNDGADGLDAITVAPAPPP